MFGFDERFAMFDITPVENQFILDLLPAARGDYIKVYLYGLMRCYHPEEGMNLDRMCHELNMSEEDVTAAFRYWERRKAVRRISDHPPVWQYVNLKQVMFTTGAEEADPKYEAFSNAIYDAFDHVRRLHGGELSTLFELHETLHLPQEVIIMLLNYMVTIKGKNFRISDAEKLAAKMAEEEIRTVEAAEEFLSRDEKAYTGVKKILKLLGKRYSLPSDAQVKMYRKWISEWHFTPEAVEEAVELTARGEPSMGYLDGILNSLRNEAGNAGIVRPEQVRASTRNADGLRQVLKELGAGSGEINPRTLRIYEEMKQLYPQSVILIAARECGNASGRKPENVLKLLESWHDRGLETEEQVTAYVRTFHDRTSLIREIRKIWGVDENKIGKTDRSLVERWERDLGFTPAMILDTAPLASEAAKPMAYLDKILEEYHQKGIDTPEKARQARETARAARKPSAGGGKNVGAQQYGQRDYGEVQEELMDSQNREMEEYLRRNGGSGDA